MVLIGDAVAGFEDYAQKCYREGEGFTQFVPAVDHHDPLLASAYAACELYVLPGWFETPGLVALEAALAGARVAVTNGGSTSEYFGEEVEYFNPAKPDSIACAIEAGVAKRGTSALKNRLIERFTWETIAQNTLQAYRQCLSRES